MFEIAGAWGLHAILSLAKKGGMPSAVSEDRISYLQVDCEPEWSSMVPSLSQAGGGPPPALRNPTDKDYGEGGHEKTPGISQGNCLSPRTLSLNVFLPLLTECDTAGYI